MSNPRDLIAVAMCDAFFAAASPPDPTRWPGATLEQRQTFDRCAAAALEAGRQARGAPDLERQVGAAISAAFWAGVARPPYWLTWSGTAQAREVFLTMARAGIETGRRLRASRSAAMSAAA